jgi:hypothetical protein
MKSLLNSCAHRSDIDAGRDTASRTWRGVGSRRCAVCAASPLRSASAATTRRVTSNSLRGNAVIPSRCGVTLALMAPLSLLGFRSECPLRLARLSAKLIAFWNLF